MLEGLFDDAGELLRAVGPGRPGQEGERAFLVRRHRGRYVRFATVLAFEPPALLGARFAPAEIVVTTASGEVTHRQTSEGWEVQDGDSRTVMKGLRRELLPGGIDIPVVGAELHKYVPPNGGGVPCGRSARPRRERRGIRHPGSADPRP